MTGEPVIDTVLSEGDAMYIPRGWVHSAQAMDSTSIHMTIGISAVTALDVARAVVDQLANHEEFRTSLPLGRDPTNQDELNATVTKVMAQVVDSLRDEAALLSAGAAAQLIRSHAERTRPLAVRPLAALDASECAGTSRVRWRDGLVATSECSDGRVLLRLPDKVMTFPMSCADAIAALHRGLAADAETLPGLDRADATVLIRRLLREAVVVPVHG